MWKVTVKGLLAHKLRLALTAIAIVLGVTFISGTFIFTDTLHNTFTTLFSNVYRNVDFQVRGVAQFSNTGAGAVRNPIPESILPAVRAVPGVETAAGTVRGLRPVRVAQGKAIASGGAPTLGLSFDADPRISELHVVTGQAPTGLDDVVMDAGTAHKYHFRGRRTGPRPAPGPIEDVHDHGHRPIRHGRQPGRRHPGCVHLADRAGGPRGVGSVRRHQRRRRTGANKAVVQHDIAQALPHGVEVVTGQTVVNEQTSTIDKALVFFSTALLVFAFISLFVGAFTILNTFSIIVGQRTRELALLRIVGASRRQVFRSVLGEAAIVGLGSSLLGLGLGVVAAIGLEALLRGFGIDLPTGTPVFRVRTVVVALLVGVGVTVVAAISPARRAVRIPPVAAITDQQVGGEISFRRRFAWGASLAVLGAAALGVGLSKPAIQLVGPRCGQASSSESPCWLPAVARPLSSVIGRPLARTLGVAGKLGRENSMRSPRRTAQTASALMVGLALVSAIAVFGASVSRSATSSVDNAMSADLIVSNNSSGSGSFSNTVPGVASAVPGVTSSSTRLR